MVNLRLSTVQKHRLRTNWRSRQQVLHNVAVTNLLGGQTEVLTVLCIKGLRLTMEERFPGCKIRFFHNDREVVDTDRLVANLNFIREADSRTAMTFIHKYVWDFVRQQSWRLRFSLGVCVWREEATAKMRFALQMFREGRPDGLVAFKLLDLFLNMLHIFFHVHPRHPTEDIKGACFPEELITLIGAIVGEVGSISNIFMLERAVQKSDDIGRSAIQAALVNITGRE